MDSALFHRLLPARVVADNLFEKNVVLFEERGLDSRNFIPGEETIVCEINGSFMSLVGPPFVHDGERFANDGTAIPEAPHFLFGRLAKTDDCKPTVAAQFPTGFKQIDGRSYFALVERIEWENIGRAR